MTYTSQTFQDSKAERTWQQDIDIGDSNEV
jgi:hypothetical protein